MKTKKIKIFKRAARWLPALLLAALPALGGCTWDSALEPEPVPEDYSDEVIITVNVPETQISSTRSIAEANGEAKVNEIDVLVFAGTTFAERVTGTVMSQSTIEAEKYLVRFRAKLTVNANVTNVAIVANATAAVTAAISAGGAGATKATLLSKLTYATTNASPNNPELWKWNAKSSTDYTPIPMYGEKAISGITLGKRIDNVALTRMLARIDVVNDATSSFNLSAVHVVNYNTGGYIAPKWDANGNTQHSTLPALNIPPAGIANPKSGTYDAMRYRYSVSGLIGDIYTYEAAGTTGVEGHDHAKAACLILEGTYEGKLYYYRVDFTDASNPVAVKYMPLYRNYRYIVTIKEASGIGYLDMDAALQSLGVMNNLKTEILIVNESELTNVVYNGQYYLGLGQEKVVFGSASKQTVDVKCLTNYPNGWIVESISYEGGAGGWLDKTLSSETLTLTTNQPNNTGADKKACVTLKAGRLTLELAVTQSAP